MSVNVSENGGEKVEVTENVTKKIDNCNFIQNLNIKSEFPAKIFVISELNAS